MEHRRPRLCSFSCFVVISHHVGFFGPKDYTSEAVREPPVRNVEDYNVGTVREPPLSKRI